MNARIKLIYSRMVRGTAKLYRIKGHPLSSTVKQKLSGRRMTRATRQTGHLVNRGGY